MLSWHRFTSLLSKHWSIAKGPRSCLQEVCYKLQRVLGWLQIACILGFKDEHLEAFPYRRRGGSA